MNETLQAIFRDVLHQPSLILRHEDAMNVLPGWDSLSHISLILALERVYSISFTAEEMLSMKCVSTIETILKQYGVQV